MFGRQASNNHHQSFGNCKKFDCHTIGNGMFWVAKMIGNEMFLVTKFMAIENISSLIVWRFFFCLPHINFTNLE
jgi:hypothetical protein